MKPFSIILFSALVLLTFSCKEVYDNPIQKKPAAILDTTFLNSNTLVQMPKRVLVEEFTGVKCSNCPDGHIVLKTLQDKYKEKMIPISIHSYFLGSPYGEEQNLTNKFAQSIWNLLGGSEKPTAGVDRIANGATKSNFPRTDWDTKIAERLTTASNANILDTIFFDNLRQKYIYQAKVEFTQETSEQVALAVALTQNKIVATQLKGIVEIEDYDHEHVLRYMFTDIKGDALLFSNGLSKYEKGRTYIKQFEIDVTKIRDRDGNGTLDSEELKNVITLENCEVVAFISKISNNNVVQATVRKVK
jgi:hypothetical protein